ncbi:hypothetical protein [Brevundimonas sp. UBA7664]|uniref:hypothetical protein n=1 Tax=Brevundimonas sp. UBA7664 TaxID=1946141 RepID=UPI0025C2A0C0|nr:hypothetical protein [Brevundimonas sp. UBA7664]
MRNILVVDGALNATFSVFQATEAEFDKIFPAPGQDIAFIEEVIAALGELLTAKMIAPIWERPILRRDVNGLHGLLIYEGMERMPFYPASRRETDWDDAALSPAQRALFALNRNS